MLVSDLSLKWRPARVFWTVCYIVLSIVRYSQFRAFERLRLMLHTIARFEQQAINATNSSHHNDGLPNP